MPTGVREKFGVEPALIPDFLALVGDAADGYPGIEGIGRVSAARLLGRYGPLESFPPEILGKRKELALLFKVLATLRTTLDCSMTSKSCAGRVPPKPSRRALPNSLTPGFLHGHSRPLETDIGPQGSAVAWGMLVSVHNLAGAAVFTSWQSLQKPRLA